MCVCFKTLAVWIIQLKVKIRSLICK